MECKIGTMEQWKNGTEINRTMEQWNNGAM